LDPRFPVCCVGDDSEKERIGQKGSLPELRMSSAQPY